MNVIEESVNCQEESLNCQEESVNCQEENKKNNAVNLERIRKTIESLISTHHIEVAKILVNHNVKLTENLNGIFINLTNSPEPVIDNELKKF